LIGRWKIGARVVLVLLLVIIYLRSQGVSWFVYLIGAKFWIVLVSFSPWWR